MSAETSAITITDYSSIIGKRCGGLVIMVQGTQKKQYILRIPDHLHTAFNPNDDLIKLGKVCIKSIVGTIDPSIQTDDLPIISVEKFELGP